MWRTLIIFDTRKLEIRLGEHALLKEYLISPVISGLTSGWHGTPSGPENPWNSWVFREVLGQGLAEILEQILRVLDSHGQPHHPVLDAHAGPPDRAHLEKNGMRHRDDQGPVVAQIAGADGQLQAIDEGEGIGPVREREAEQGAGALEKLLGQRMLGIGRQSRIVDRLHLGMP